MSYPTDPEFADVKVTSRHANIRSETRSGRTQVRSIGSQRWALTGRYNDLKRTEFAPVFAFVMAQKGGTESFTIVPPVFSSTLTTITGTPRVNGDHTQGDTTISVDGFTGTFKAGDFIKFTSHSKVYMVVADRSGSGSMTIEPGLLEDLSNNELIVYQDVPFTVRLENNVQEWSLGGFDRYNFEVDFIEVI